MVWCAGMSIDTVMVFAQVSAMTMVDLYENEQLRKDTMSLKTERSGVQGHIPDGPPPVPSSN
jgi:hypothetical protein